MESSSPNWPRRFATGFLRLGGRAVESGTPVAVVLLLAGMGLMAGAVAFSQAAGISCPVGYPSGDPCEQAMYRQAATLIAIGAVGIVVACLAFPVWIASYGARRRRARLGQGGARHLNEARGWMVAGRLSATEFSQLRVAVDPLARGTHAALGARAAAGLVSGWGSVAVAMGVMGLFVAGMLISEAGELHANGQSVVGATVLPVAAVITVLGVVASIVGAAGAMAAGTSLAAAQTAGQDAFEAAAVAAAGVPAAGKSKAASATQEPQEADLDPPVAILRTSRRRA